MANRQTVKLVGAVIILSELVTGAQCLAGGTPGPVTSGPESMTAAEAAIWKLRAEGPDAVPSVLAALNQPDQKLRGIAIGVLGEIGDASALAALSRIAASDDPWSDLARQNVAKIGGPDAATCLIGLLQRHVMGDRAARIADDLGAIGDNHAVEPLIQLLRGQLIGRRGVQDAYSDMEKVRAREAAATALGRFRDPRARAALKKAVAEDPDWDVYFASKGALRQMQMDRAWDGDWRSVVPLAVEKQPEPPEGADAFVRQWKRDNAGKMMAWRGPSVQDYVAAGEIARARAQLLDASRFAPTEIVETLMTYLRNRKLIYGPKEAKTLILQIGAPAIPALEIGEDRGDIAIKRHCRECLAAIRGRSATHPTQ